MNITAEKRTKPFKNRDLTKIYSLKEKNIQFYMDTLGDTYWEHGHSPKQPLRTLPQEMQIPFLLKFIQDHSLGERLKSIKDPITAIDTYIRKTFVDDTDVYLDE